MDRVGEVWLGVQLEDEADVCLGVRSEVRRQQGIAIGFRHFFVDLSTGEEFTRREDYRGHYQLERFADAPGRRRLV